MKSVSRAATFLGLAYLLMAALFGIVLLTLALRPVFAHWHPEYAQIYSPQELEWFNKQLIPGTKNRCCSASDGTYALEDIRNGHYWAKFHYKIWENDNEDETQTNVEKESDWMEVPTAAVITEPNLHGSPAVWYYITGYGQVKIRCFSPGSKM